MNIYFVFHITSLRYLVQSASVGTQKFIKLFYFSFMQHNNHHRRSLADRRWAFWRKQRRRFLLAKKMEAPSEALASNSLSRCIDELRQVSNRGPKQRMAFWAGRGITRRGVHVCVGLHAEIRRIVRLLEVAIQGFWYLNVITIVIRVLVATVCYSEGHTSISVQANALIPSVIWHCDLQFIKVVISRAVPMLRWVALPSHPTNYTNLFDYYWVVWPN